MLSQNNNSSVIYSTGEIESLINKAKAGDKEAFSLIYKHFLTPLYRYVLSRCGDIHLSEDICQTTFLRFYSSLGRYEIKTSPLAYLFTIARRILINEYHKFKSEEFDDETFDQIENNHDFINEIDIKLISKHIDNFIKELTQNEQEVINLLYFSELSIKEVSEILEKKEDWVRQIKHRALKKLHIRASHLSHEK